MKSWKLALFAIAFFVLHACQKSDAFDSEFNKFRDYITSFSSGSVSAHREIRVGLAFTKAEWKPNQEFDASVFSISPSVKGKAILLPNNVLAFKPEKPLEQDTEYRVTLHLSKLLDVPADLSEFNFTIRTLKQDLVVEKLDLQSYNADSHFLNAQLRTADNLSQELAPKIITASQDGQPLEVKFTASSGTRFPFMVDGIKRKRTPSKVVIKWDGDAASIDKSGEVEMMIPARDQFKVVDVRVADENNQSLHINFSDPIKKDQDFSGLVVVESAMSLQYAVDGNVLKVFFDQPLNGVLLTEVFQGIQNVYGDKMERGYAAKVTFEDMKPAIRLVRSGTILPQSANLKLNFQAVNLSHVDVKVYRIFENNVLQFLQDNTLDGQYDLRKVALPIAKKTLELTTNKTANYKLWNTYALDLSSLIKPQPGAIYRVEFSYKPAYSLYTCAGGNTMAANEEDEEPEDFSTWNDSYDYYDYDYNWSERENPCHKSYYYDNKLATNVLASNLGVIAKKGNNSSLFFAVTNLVTTQPVSGADITLYNLQRQPLGTFATGSDGTAQITPQGAPYFAVVKKDESTTYLKLDEGYSQSVSNFNVSGTTLQKGLKGFLYGERGVWRPGDTLHLAFMLNDRAVRLPMTHPVKFRLNDPNGKTIFQSVKSYDPKNHYKFVLRTQPNSPTGNYEAMVSVGGARFYKSIKIETVKPNRLKIKNSFEGARLTASRPNQANVEVSWLHGAPGKNLKIEMQAKFFRQETAFKNYPGYVFDDPSKSFSSEEINIFSGTVNDAGRATVSLPQQVDLAAPGMLRAQFLTKAFESGGDFSTDVASATYSPFTTYVGIKTPTANKFGMLETGVRNNFTVVTVDDAGRPKPSANLRVNVYKVEWRWWWDASQDDLSQYNSAQSNVAYYSQKLSTGQSGKATFGFVADENDWGRYLILVTDEDGGHTTGQTVLIDWPSWSGKTRNQTGDEAKMLIFTSDKEKYNTGEQVTLSFPSSKGGRALVSLENGSEVVKTIWVETAAGETQVKFEATPDLAPNVYAYITLLQPHASTVNDAPMRLYGVLPIEVVDKNTVLEPVIHMPDVIRPQQKTSISVSEKSGREMTYTVAIVDEGLLDLTRFKTPDPWSGFYAREALGVKTWDVYDDVIGAYGGRINQIFKIGGDEDLGGGKAKKANRFKPVVKYLGPFHLKKGEKAVHNITLPRYIGSVRTMVVASDAANGRYGQAEKTTAVRSPLMVLASMPRKVSPGENITLPVTVFAMEKGISSVSVSVKAKGFKAALPVQTLNFQAPDEKLAFFKLTALPQTGIGTVTVTATSGKHKATYDVEIDVLNPNPVMRRYKEVLLQPGASGAISWDSFGVTGSNRAQVEVSTFPAIDLAGRMDYLIHYPHGCVEQITSGVFPQLYLADIADIDQTRKSSIQRNVSAGIQKLAGYQNTAGGFSYWPGQSNPDDWSTSYAGHFLIEAEKKGYALPANLKNSWLGYQARSAREWRYNAQYHNDFAQAYRLYTLALAGKADLSSMNRLRETVGISNESRLRLAAAYALAGQKTAGLRLLNTSKIDPAPDKNDWYYYGSPERNRAMMTETLILLGREREAFVAARKVAESLSSGVWMSTQTTAMSLFAVSKYARMYAGGGVDATITVNGTASDIKSAKSFANRDVAVKTKNQLAVKNKRTVPLYVRVMYSGILPVGREQAEQRGVLASVSYRDRQGQPVNVASLKQGTEFVAHITVTSQSAEAVKNMALTHIIPSGWEIINTRFTDYGGFGQNKADYIDIRDDRTHFYFDLDARETKTFKVLLNASYPGDFYLAGVQCEAMYDNNFLSRTRGEWVKVEKSP